jgi:hypothetical protein
MNRKLIKFDSAEAMVFDGLTAAVWQIEMVSSVNPAPPMRNIIPGVLYTFVFHQNQAGNNTFAWPSPCLNAAPISLGADTSTAQNFIGTADGKLLANIPATYF